jgi:hypothetical protein
MILGVGGPAYDDQASAFFINLLATYIKPKKLY